MILKNIAAAAAQNLADRASNVIDANRDQLVTEFEQAVVRQRTEFVRDLTAITARLARSGLIAASIIGVGLIVLALAHFLHR